MEHIFPTPDGVLADGASTETQKRDWSKGLYGGVPELRRRHGRGPMIAGPLLLDPHGSTEEQSAFDAWVDGSDALEVEIGFGRGRFFAAHCLQYPEVRLLGFEIRTRFCADLMHLLAAAGCEDRARVAQCDARPLLAERVADRRLAAVHVNFPDPWWKKRHQRRTVLSEEFIDVIWHKLRPQGALYFRTDVTQYAEAVREHVLAHGGFAVEVFPLGRLAPTYREVRCEDYGLPVHRYCFRRTALHESAGSRVGGETPW